MKGPEDLRARLEAKALDEGFVSMGICRPDAIPEAAERLQGYLDAGYHGQMGWMAERVAWRGNPDQLWPEARSVIMLAQSYTPEESPLPLLKKRSHGVLTSYARGRDYHDLLKRKLKVLGRWLIAEAPEAEIKVFTDTAPVMEKPLAQAAGLGWQGKHTVVLSRDFGNWVFLGAIFTTLELPVDPPASEHCGSCTACLDICPTQAFVGPWKLDARRCISYLTIEHRGPVDEELRPLMGNHVFGCDDCLAVCPWNKFAAQASEMRYHRMEGALPLAELAMLDDAAFRALFAGSAVKRTGRDRFVRNVLYAIGNSGDMSLRAVAAKLLDDPDPAVADAAQWAVRRLETP